MVKGCAKKRATLGKSNTKQLVIGSLCCVSRHINFIAMIVSAISTNSFKVLENIREQQNGCAFKCSTDIPKELLSRICQKILKWGKPRLNVGIIKDIY